MLNALNKIYNSGSAGQELLSFFANDMNTADIFATEKGNQIDTDKNKGNPIYLNSELKGSQYIPTTSGLQKSPFFIDTAHELAHRRDFIQNPDKISDIWYLVPKYPGFGSMSYDRADILQTEKNAMHTENLIRLDSNLPLRTHYQNYEPSRVIDLINGKYVNVHNNYIYK